MANQPPRCGHTIRSHPQDSYTFTIKLYGGQEAVELRTENAVRVSQTLAVSFDAFFDVKEMFLDNLAYVLKIDRSRIQVRRRALFWACGLVCFWVLQLLAHGAWDSVLVLGAIRVHAGRHWSLVWSVVWSVVTGQPACSCLLHHQLMRQGNSLSHIDCCLSNTITYGAMVLTAPIICHARRW